MAGYAIECALKAIIAAQFREGEIPDRALVNRVYSHDLAELVRLAGLEADLKAATEEFDGLNQRWSTINQEVVGAVSVYDLVTGGRGGYAVRG